MKLDLRHDRLNKMAPLRLYAIVVLILSCLSGCVPGRTSAATDSESGQDANVKLDSDASMPTDADPPADTDPKDAGGDTSDDAANDTVPPQDMPTLDSDAAPDADAPQDAMGDLEEETDQGDAVLGDDSPDGDDAGNDADGSTAETYAPTAEELKVGILQPAPTTPVVPLLGTFEVRSDRDIVRDMEVAYSAIPLSSVDEVTDVSRLMVVDEKGMWVQAQFKALSYWGRPLGDANTPGSTRWLQITLPMKMPGLSTRTFSLRHYAGQEEMPSPPNDPLAVTVSNATDGKLVVNTGAAIFELNLWNPALITKIIRVTPQGSGTVLIHAAGNGPSLTLGGATLTTAAAYTPGSEGEVYVDVLNGGLGGAKAFLIESGPVRAVIRLGGTFKHYASKCANGEQRFKFTAEFGFTRGRADVDLRVNLHNRCSNALSDFETTPNTHSFSDDAFQVDAFSWAFPLSLTATTTYYSYHETMNQYPFAQSGDQIRLSQEKGTGTWQRRAHATVGGANPMVTELTSLELPFVGLSDGATFVGGTMPWMRYREPQALTATESSIVFNFVSEPLVVGEAKALWGVAKLVIDAPPANLLVARGVRDRAILAVERGLLLRRPLAEFNGTRVLPWLGDALRTSTLKTLYSAIINTLHEDTIAPQTGQWAKAFTYGSQLWPDIQEMSNIVWNYTSPLANKPALNVGDPSRAEFLEFYRTGDPKYVWDFALPQSYLLAFTAWYNTGRSQKDDNGLGVSVDSTPETEGNWHRTGTKDSFSYARTENGGIMHAYVIRPNSLLLERMAQFGASVPLFYSEPRLPGEWWKKVTPGRYLSGQGEIATNFYQALTHLANCAEFVADPLGKTCVDKLDALMTELRDDNMTLQVHCAGEEKPLVGSVVHPYTGTGCIISGYGELLDKGLEVLHRYSTTLKPIFASTVLWSLSVTIKTLYQALPRTADAVPKIDVQTTWSSWLACNVDSTPSINGCTMTEPDTSVRLEASQRLQFLGLLLLNWQFSDNFDYCTEIKPLLESGNVLTDWQDLFTFRTGWDAQTAYHMQSMAYIVGSLDNCL